MRLSLGKMGLGISQRTGLEPLRMRKRLRLWHTTLLGWEASWNCSDGSCEDMLVLGLQSDLVGTITLFLNGRPCGQ